VHAWVATLLDGEQNRSDVKQQQAQNGIRLGVAFAQWSDYIATPHSLCRARIHLKAPGCDWRFFPLPEALPLRSPIESPHSAVVPKQRLPPLGQKSPRQMSQFQ
jgi:hypothetical protein